MTSMSACAGCSAGAAPAVVTGTETLTFAVPDMHCAGCIGDS